MYVYYTAVRAVLNIDHGHYVIPSNVILLYLKLKIIINQ